MMYSTSTSPSPRPSSERSRCTLSKKTQEYLCVLGAVFLFCGFASGVPLNHLSKSCQQVKSLIMGYVCIYFCGFMVLLKPVRKTDRPWAILFTVDFILTIVFGLIGIHIFALENGSCEVDDGYEWSWVLVAFIVNMVQLFFVGLLAAIGVLRLVYMLFTCR